MKKNSINSLLALEEVSALTAAGYYHLEFVFHRDEQLAEPTETFQQFPPLNSRKELGNYKVYYQDPTLLMPLMQHACMATSIHLQYARDTHASK